MTSILIILVANPIFTYRELGAIMENSAFYIKDWDSLDKSIRDMRSLLIFKQFFNSFYNIILLNILILYFLLFI